MATSPAATPAAPAAEPAVDAPVVEPVAMAAEAAPAATDDKVLFMMKFKLGKGTLVDAWSTFGKMVRLRCESGYPSPPLRACRSPKSCIHTRARARTHARARAHTRVLAVLRLSSPLPQHL